MSFRYVAFHTKKYEPLNINKKFTIASIDPGLVNFAIRIEIRIPDKNPKCILFEKIKFGDYKSTQAVKKKGCSILELWGNVLNYLESRSEYFDLVDIYVFEQQLSPNHKVTRLAQHVQTYFMTKYRNKSPYPILVEVSPRLKTRIICPGEKLKGKALKDRSVKVAKKLLRKRKDFKSVKIIKKQFTLVKGKKKKKEDDLADTVNQLEAFLNLFA
jgi:hypothetical protein